MTEPELILLSFGALFGWWHGAAIVSVMQSRRGLGKKLGWAAAIVLLPPFGLAAYALRGRGSRKRRGIGVTGYLTIATLGAGALLALQSALWPGHAHIAWIAAWSVTTFVFYAIDKAAAVAGKDDEGRSKRARVDEAALHLFAVLGGFAGGWIGRHGLRHKTKDPWFAVVLALGTVLHASKLLGLW